MSYFVTLSLVCRQARQGDVLRVFHLVVVEWSQVLDLIRTLLRRDGDQPAMPFHESCGQFHANVISLAGRKIHVDAGLFVIGPEYVLSGRKLDDKEPAVFYACKFIFVTVDRRR